MAVRPLLFPAIGRADMFEDELGDPCIGVGVAPPILDIWLVLEVAWLSMAGRKLLLGSAIELPAWYCIKASVSYLIRYSRFSWASCCSP